MVTIQNPDLLVPPLTLRTKLKLHKNWRHIFEEFVQNHNVRPSHSCINDFRESITLVFYFTLVDHPPFSTDLAPSDFHLCPRLKKHLREHHFWSEDDVKTVVKMWFHQQETQLYCDELMKLPECWLKCVDHRDDYVESNCMKLQTDFNKSVQCCFSEISIHIKGKIRWNYFSACLQCACNCVFVCMSTHVHVCLSMHSILDYN
jgi:hypothetical protein